jgi:DNA repair protein RadC
MRQAQPTLPRPSLREQLVLLGEGSLSDAECLALILGTGTRGESAVLLGQRLLDGFGGLAGLAGASVHDLRQMRGLKLARATALVAALALQRRLASAVLPRGRTLRDPQEVAGYFAALLRGRAHEEFHVLHLDTRHRALCSTRVSLGSAEAVLVHPREVFAPGIRAGSAAFVVAHNHPSGDPTPSQEDRLMTERLDRAGQLLGILLLDHLVLGDSGFYSFALDRVVALPRPPQAETASGGGPAPPDRRPRTRPEFVLPLTDPHETAYARSASYRGHVTRKPATPTGKQALRVVQQAPDHPPAPADSPGRSPPTGESPA